MDQEQSREESENIHLSKTREASSMRKETSRSSGNKGVVDSEILAQQPDYAQKEKEESRSDLLIAPFVQGEYIIIGSLACGGTGIRD